MPENYVSLQAPSFRGTYRVIYIGGEPAELELVGAMYDTQGHPIYLFDKDGIVYNWNAIVMIRPYDKEEPTDAGS